MEKDNLVRDDLTDRVIDRIQKMIWSGEIVPGGLLPPQKELAEKFGVGLSTIREAIKALSHVGMVEVTPGRGTIILPDAMEILSSEKAFRSNFSDVDPEVFYEARGVVETALTEMTLQRATQEEIQELQDILMDMKSAQLQEDVDKFSKADIRFHLAVAKASKNEVLEKMYYLILNIIKEMIHKSNEKPAGMAYTYQIHKEILTGIIAKDPKLTQQATNPIKYKKLSQI